MSIEHEMNLEDLISLVQERQSIYDYENKNHSNRNIQEQLWTEISDILKVPGLYIFIILILVDITILRKKKKCVIDNFIIFLYFLLNINHDSNKNIITK